MKNKGMKLLIAGIMTTAMALTLCPTSAFAVEEVPAATESTVSDEQQGEAADGAVDATTSEETQAVQQDLQADENQEAGVAAQSEEIDTQANGSLVVYSGHQQTFGNLAATQDGATLGNIGVAKRFEALTINKGTALANVSGDIYYRVHGQTYGTQEWKTTGQLAGTTGKAKRVEAIQIYLTGQLAEQYDVYYRSHIQTYGWMNWVKGGTDEATAMWSGSTGLYKRMEAIQIVFVAKGSGAPTPNPANTTAQGYRSPTDIGNVMYTAHQQTYGNQSLKADGETIGITGQAKRLEALTVTKGNSLANLSGDIYYQVHGQTYGDQEWKSSGQLAGTTGKAKRVEAIRMSLSGQLGEQYDIYYRVHCQTFGWMSWTKGGTGEKAENSAWAGTSDFGLRMEALQITIVPKGTTPATTNPANLTDASFQNEATAGTLTYSGYQEGAELQVVTGGSALGVTGESKKLTGIKIKYNSNTLIGNIKYSAYMQTTGWNDWVSDGNLAGLTTNDKRMEAIRIELSGNAAKLYDVWYRVHVQTYGWLGWAKNGQDAGSSGQSKRIESIEIKLVSKVSQAPGPNKDYFKSSVEVYLDAGHGGYDSGAVNGSRKEANDTLKIALAVQKKLEDRGVSVMMARVDSDPGYTSIQSLYDRCYEANKYNASLYVSFHRDSASSTATGFSIYTHNPANDSSSRANKDEWANKDSGSKTLSQNISTQLASLGTYNNRGIIYGSAGNNSSYDLIVNRYTNMPSCLIELGFISNNSDNEIYDKYLDAHATAIAKGIMKSLGKEY